MNHNTHLLLLLSVLALAPRAVCGSPATRVIVDRQNADNGSKASIDGFHERTPTGTGEQRAGQLESPEVAAGSGRQWLDLLKWVNPTNDTVAGKWTLESAGLEVLPSAYARLMLPVVPDGNYELDLRFMRVAGDEILVVHLPTGSSPVTAILAAKGGYYGLETIGGKGVRENATTRRQGGLERGREHHFAVKVTREGGGVAIEAALNGRSIINWKGPASALSAHSCWSMPNRMTPGLCTYGSQVIFRSVRLRMLSGEAKRLWPKAGAAVFRPGRIWPDNRGVHINAHGGGVLYHQGTYYWFGEHRTEGWAGNRSHVGVHCYSSDDLYHWEDEGIVLHNADDPDHELAKGCVLQRPKVIHNAATGKFVMWFHLEFKGQGYKTARSAVAVADRVTGPYRYTGSFRPNGQGARDMTLFADDDGKAYLLYSSKGNRTLHTALLRDDYLRPTDEYERAFVGRMMEAPAVCKRRGRYYFLASGCTGYAPNAARSAVADSIWGPWKELGNPCLGINPANGLGPGKTFGSQSTFILPVHGRDDAFVAMFDIWRVENQIDARHVWLPIRFVDEGFAIEWTNTWDLTVFDDATEPPGATRPPDSTPPGTGPPKRGAAFGTIGVEVTRSARLGGHVCQLWRIRSSHAVGDRYRVSVKHASAGDDGAFFITAWADTRGDGTPDTRIGISRLYRAASKDAWSSWEFETREKRVFVGNCWDIPPTHYYQTAPYLAGYGGLSSTMHFTRTPDAPPTSRTGPRFTNIRVQVVR